MDIPKYARGGLPKFSIQVVAPKELIDELLERSKVEKINFDSFIRKILRKYLDEKKTSDIYSR